MGDDEPNATSGSSRRWVNPVLFYDPGQTHDLGTLLNDVARGRSGTELTGLLYPLTPNGLLFGDVDGVDDGNILCYRMLVAHAVQASEELRGVPTEFSDLAARALWAAWTESRNGPLVELNPRDVLDRSTGRAAMLARLKQEHPSLPVNSEEVDSGRFSDEGLDSLAWASRFVPRHVEQALLQPRNFDLDRSALIAWLKSDPSTLKTSRVMFPALDGRRLDPGALFRLKLTKLTVPTGPDRSVRQIVVNPISLAAIDVDVDFTNAIGLGIDASDLELGSDEIMLVDLRLMAKFKTGEHGEPYLVRKPERVPHQLTGQSVGAAALAGATDIAHGGLKPKHPVFTGTVTPGSTHHDDPVPWLDKKVTLVKLARAHDEERFLDDISLWALGSGAKRGGGSLHYWNSPDDLLNGQPGSVDSAAPVPSNTVALPEQSESAQPAGHSTSAMVWAKRIGSVVLAGAAGFGAAFLIISTRL